VAEKSLDEIQQH